MFSKFYLLKCLEIFKNSENPSKIKENTEILKQPYKKNHFFFSNFIMLYNQKIIKKKKNS